MRRIIGSVVLIVAVILTACAPQPVAQPAASNAAPASNAGGEAKALNGAGATFPAVLYSKWFNEYNKATGVQVNYQSIGSGGGIKSISDATVDFGASDSPMTDEQLKAAKGEILHIPMALGAVVPTYNLPGVTAQLKFTPDTLAGIFLGDIKTWNDPALVADNPDLQAVDKPIIVVHRSDGSGTTSIWVNYLSTVNKKWESSVGRGTSVKWPVGLGGKGNEGVAGEVKNNANSLGYVELIYAIQNKLPVGQVKNKAGKFITPNLDSVKAAAASIVNSIPDDLRFTMVDAAGNNSYPISGATWLLVYKNMTDKSKATTLTKMLWWNIHDAQQFNADLGYGPLPAELVTKAEAKIKSITVDGQPAFTGK
jgi:phosphate transport system substrate-binding protein